jgi:hypothetical protein
MLNRKLVENDKRVKLERCERLGVRSRQQLQRLLALLCGSPTLQSGFNRNSPDLTEITNLKVTSMISILYIKTYVWEHSNKVTNFYVRNSGVNRNKHMHRGINLSICVNF